MEVYWALCLPRLLTQTHFSKPAAFELEELLKLSGFFKSSPGRSELAEKGQLIITLITSLLKKEERSIM